MTKSNGKDSHKKYLILTAILPKQAFISSILVIFYLSRLNISFSEYLMLDAIMFISAAIMELPSGFLADYFGRKKVLIIGLFLDLISMVVLLFANSFMGGLLSIIILSLGLSMGSGNAQSILYEFYDNINEVDSYKKINSNANSIMLVCISLYSICSGFIFKMNINYILYLDILFIVFHIIVTYIFLIDNKPNGSKQSAKKQKKVWDVSVINFQSITKPLPIFITLSLLFSFFRVSYNYYQPMYEYLNIPVEVFGFFPIIYNGLAALGSQLYKKMIGELKTERVQIYVIIAILSFSLIGLFIFRDNAIGFLVVIFIQQICRGADISLQPVMLNGAIPKNTNYRTMYISFFSMINTLLVFLFTMISSAILGYVDLITALFTITSMILLLLSIVNFKKRNPNTIYEVT